MGYMNQRVRRWEDTDAISLADAKSVSGASGEGDPVEVGARGGGSWTSLPFWSK